MEEKFNRNPSVEASGQHPNIEDHTGNNINGLQLNRAKIALMRMRRGAIVSTNDQRAVSTVSDMVSLASEAVLYVESYGTEGEFPGLELQTEIQRVIKIYPAIEGPVTSAVLKALSTHIRDSLVRPDVADPDQILAFITAYESDYRDEYASDGCVAE